MVGPEIARSEGIIERAVLTKVLTRLVPFLALLYVFNMLDRNNVSLAALTMKQDLKFNDAIYGFGAGIFFIGYFLFEVPSNLIMERVGARKWIARILLTWGAISAAMLWVKTPFSFYALRFLLGLAEAGFYPGILLYLTYWIPERARAKAIARFLALTSLLGLFGGPLSGALLSMNGLGGLKGWQWLFLVEGVPSMLLSLAVFRFLPDTPEQANWLAPIEKEWIRDRLAEEARNDHRVQHLSWKVALSDSRMVQMCLIFFLTAVGGNMIGSFGPQFLKSKSGGLWSDTFIANIGIIPAAVGALAMLLAAAHSDRTGKRRRHVTVGYFVAGVAFMLCAFAPNASWVVAAFALNALGERCAAGSYWTLTTSMMGARAAAGGIAFINSVGNLGGFFGPILMAQIKTHPRGGYNAGLWIAGLLFVTAAVLAHLLRRQAIFNSAPAPITSV